jgi:uncharacterized damage-inducible protein DinB
MMKRTAWFDRKFAPITDNGLFPCILERLEGTSVRLKSKIDGMEGDLTLSTNEKWSIHKEIGHLIDLEPLWLERTLQIIRGEINLKKTDLTNQKTHDANHDKQNIYDLIYTFEKERKKLLQIVRATTEKDLEKAAIHPRLGTPMTLIDLAFFVAEHDDHHLAQITTLHHSLT